jgi:N-acetylmuramoyl-L-alanine amidase
MKSIILALLWLTVMPNVTTATAVAIKNARISNTDSALRLVLDASAPIAAHKIFSLTNPDRVVIDLPNTQLDTNIPKPAVANSFLNDIRSGVRQGLNLRIVLDLKRPIRVKSFVLEPDDQFGHRLVIDLLPRIASQQASSPPQTIDHESINANVTATHAQSSLRKVIVAIDAGHGGKDPGAIGPNGTQEKWVTLAVARHLKTVLDQEPGMEAIMIRNSDRFIALRDRIRIARKHYADLFVSIHADAFHDTTVRGSSVFTLSERGATSEAAKWLAQRENDADLLGGIHLGNNEEVATVLIEMTQNLTMEHSNIAASHVLERLQKIGTVHQKRVQSAGFAVLRAPDIPSMLIETAFISNTDDEQQLTNRQFQSQMANALLAGIRDYFTHYPPPQTLLAQANLSNAKITEPKRQHVVSWGDTLSDIAEYYHVSLQALRELNHLSDDRIHVGQILEIPTGLTSPLAAAQNP